jgi:CheY-like chemotaxis protein
MPVMDGFTFARAIREWELSRSTASGEDLSQHARGRQCMCVLSSNFGPTETEQCAQIGVDFFEQKPVRGRVSVDNYLHRKKLQQFGLQTQ